MTVQGARRRLLGLTTHPMDEANGLVVARCQRPPQVPFGRQAVHASRLGRVDREVTLVHLHRIDAIHARSPSPGRRGVKAWRLPIGRNRLTVEGHLVRVAGSAKARLMSIRISSNLTHQATLEDVFVTHDREGAA